MKGSKVGKVVAMVFVGISIAVTLGLVLGLGLQWLWNQLMPEIFGLPPISYWQAVGLFVLSHLLFKGHHHHPPPPHDRARRPRRRRSFDNHESSAEASSSTPDPVAEKIRKLLDEDRPAEEATSTEL